MKKLVGVLSRFLKESGICIESPRGYLVEC